MVKLQSSKLKISKKDSKTTKTPAYRRSKSSDFSIFSFMPESVRLIISNLKLFIPSILMIILNFLLTLTPAYKSFMAYSLTKQSFDPNLLISFFGLLIISTLLSLIILSWQFLLLRNLINKGETDLFTEFSSVFSYFGKIIGVSSILLIPFFIIVLVIALFFVLAIFLLKTVPVVGGILSLLSLTLLLSFMLFGGAFLISLFSVIILEKLNSLNLIKSAFNNYKTNLKLYLKLFLITLMFMIPFGIIQIMVQQIINLNYPYLVLSNPLQFELIILPLNVISTILVLFLQIFYLKVYMAKK